MNDDELRKLVRSALPPVEDAELKRDLWPRMLARLEEPQLRVSWLDWTLAGLAAAWSLSFPKLILGLMYHL